MSDLVGGSGSGSGQRATNGGVRAQGPVPVTQSSQTPARSQVTTPRDIMRRREERRAQAEANARLQQEAERAGVTGAVPEQQPQQSAAVPSTGHRRTGSGAPTRAPEDTSSYPAYSRPLQPQTQPLTTGGPVISPPHQQQQQQQQQQRPQPQSQQPIDPSSPYRTRTSSQSQGQPRPAQSQQSTQPPVAGSSQPRQTQPAVASSSSARPAEAATGHRSTASQGTTSSFPHAFERWETLSSHWEGLTSYWIRKLEQNPEELQRQPLLNQLSRQVTDLSAAGANLFHAVVELQRLRASSERKFQRWFYESRKEQERQQEITAQLEAALVSERQARSKDLNQLQDEIGRAQRAERNAQTMVSEIKRELQISKDEARRAWEELGRREQEERDRTVALRDGQPIVIGGVQVFPTVQQPGHEAIGQQIAYEGITQGTDLQQEVYDGGESPTNTDPFIETGSPRHVLHHEPATLLQPYPPESAFARSDSTARTAIQTSTAEPYASTSETPYEPEPVSGAGPFYQHGNTYLHSTTQPVSGAGDEQSYVTSSEGFTEEDDETDQYGNIIPRRGLQSEGSDDEEDVGSQIEHENQLLQQFSGGRPLVDYPVVPPLSSTSAPPPVPTVPTSYAKTSPESSPSRHRPQQQQQQQQQTPPSSTAAVSAAQAGLLRPTIVPPPAPDYSGEAYGSPQDSRHYYPTRLSDVPEEDERSRVSEATQGGTSG